MAFAGKISKDTGSKSASLKKAQEKDNASPRHTGTGLITSKTMKPAVLKTSKTAKPGVMLTSKTAKPGVMLTRKDYEARVKGPLGVKAFEAQRPAPNSMTFINAGPKPANVQAKLEIGSPNDEFEKEADAMADKVTKSPKGIQKGGSDGEEETVQPQIQKKAHEDEEIIQSKQSVQRTLYEENEVLQQKPGIQKNSDGTTQASPVLASQLSSTKGGGQSLPKKVQGEMDSKINADFGGVKVHSDNQATEMSSSIGAKAFTHGKDIYFNKGQYNPTSQGGKHLLAHELTHTVQQGGGNVKKMIQPQFDKGDEVDEAQKFFNTLLYNARRESGEKKLRKSKRTDEANERIKRYKTLRKEVVKEIKNLKKDDNPFYFNPSNLRYFLNEHREEEGDIYDRTLRDPKVYKFLEETEIGEAFEKITEEIEGGTHKFRPGDLGTEVDTITEPTGYTEEKVDVVDDKPPTKVDMLTNLNLSVNQLYELINNNTSEDDPELEKAQIEIVESVLLAKVDAPTLFEKYVEIKKHLVGVIVRSDLDDRIKTELASWNLQELFDKLFLWENDDDWVSERNQVKLEIDRRVVTDLDREKYIELQNVTTGSDKQADDLMDKKRDMLKEMKKLTSDEEVGVVPEIEKLLREVTIVIDPGHGYIPGVSTIEKPDRKVNETLYTQPMSDKIISELRSMVPNPVSKTNIAVSNDKNVEAKAKEAEELNDKLDAAMASIAEGGEHELSDNLRLKDDDTYTFVTKITQEELDEILGKGVKTVEKWEETTEKELGHITDFANLYGNYFISIHYDALHGAPIGKGQRAHYEPKGSSQSFGESESLAKSIIGEQTVIKPKSIKQESYFVTRNFLGTAAVLLEVAFLDNPTEMAKVGGEDATDFDQCATEIASGIAKYVNGRKVE